MIYKLNKLCIYFDHAYNDDGGWIIGRLKVWQLSPTLDHCLEHQLLLRCMFTGRCSNFEDAYTSAHKKM